MAKTQNKRPQFIGLTIGSLLISIALFIFLIKLRANNNIDNITSDRLYYLILFPLGFSTAFCLFGILKSVALYNGQQFGGTLQLGGPVLIFIGVVYGGLKLIPPQTPFTYTFYFKDASGQSVDMKGFKLTVFLGSEPKAEQIAGTTGVDVKNIPQSYKDQSVSIELSPAEWVFDNGHSSANIRLTGDHADLQIHRPQIFSKVFGRVNESGHDDLFIGGVEIDIQSLSAFTDSAGKFSIEIPPSMQSNEYRVLAIKKGYRRWDYTVSASNSGIPIALRKE